MFCDDSITDAQAEAGSLSDGLCGVKGIENSRGILHSRTAIGELNDQALALHGCSNPKIAFCGTLEDGVHSVVHHVQKHLLQLMRISGRHRKVGSEVQMDPNVAHARSEERRVGKEWRSRWPPYR